ncbi:MAG: hypothetical protein HOG20_06550 [Candidatus Marinimicrobia bacterium]|nr:hypothetical protein [Candidatus Neomarinimicrobiota bacterium]
MKYLCILIAIMSCSDYTNQQSELESITNQDYHVVGVEHNNVLHYYYDSYHSANRETDTIDGNISLNFINGVLGAIKSYSFENGYDTSEVNTAITNINNFFESSGLLIEIEGKQYLSNFVQSSDHIINSAIAGGSLNNDAYDEIKHIKRIFDDGEPIDTIKTLVENLPIDTYNSSEMEPVLYFISTFSNSFDFWRSNYKIIDMNESFMNYSSYVIMWDAYGGLLGGYLGPAGSIFYGALYSIMSNEGCG